MMLAKMIFPNTNISHMIGRTGDTEITTYAILRKIYQKNIKISMVSFWTVTLTEKLKVIAELMAMKF